MAILMSKTDKLIEEIYEKLNCSKYITDHCNAVYKRSFYITQHYDDIDMELVKAGCKLHDVGRTITNGIEHAYLGADLLRKEGVDEKICLITERHIGAGITPEESESLGLPKRKYVPETLEEKIVAHADNLVHGITPVDLNFVIEKWTNKDMNKKSIDMLINLHKELLGDQ